MSAVQGFYGFAVEYSRYIYLAAALYIVIRLALAMFFKRTSNPVRGRLINTITGDAVPLFDSEASIGRSKTCDIVLNFNTVSRSHAVIAYRNKGFEIYDTHSKSGVAVNGEKIKGRTLLRDGDTVELGGLVYELEEVTYKFIKDRSRAAARPSYTVILVILTVINLISLYLNSFSGGEFNFITALSYVLFILLIWGYTVFAAFALRIHNFELEMLAFLFSSIGLAVTGSIYPDGAFRQFGAIFIGAVGFCALVAVMRFIPAVKVLRWIGAFAAIGLLGATLLLAEDNNGALNWVTIAGISLQPSELVKVIFVFVSAVTLERLQSVRSLTAYIIFTAACVGELFVMRDFGAALIFFFTFVIAAFMRSGDVKTIMLVCFAAALGAAVIIFFKPYVATRFATYMHIWEVPDEGGYQQTRTLIYSASGGLFGLGLGNGELRYIFAAAEDLIFGVVSEEFGLIMSFLIVAAYILVTLNAVFDCRKAKSAFYSVGAVLAAGMMLFQTALNVLGVTDILPMTGVTLPFVSKGGSSVICCFCLFAFIKAADVRTYASFKPALPEPEEEASE